MSRATPGFSCYGLEVGFWLFGVQFQLEHSSDWLLLGAVVLFSSMHKTGNNA